MDNEKCTAITSLEKLNEYILNKHGNPLTDKNSHHSYLPLYDKLLLPIKEKAKTILEIGVLRGGSIKLWYDYFKKATIYGLDIKDLVKINELKKKKRIILNLSINAYDKNFVKTNFEDKDIKFDFILDDGPHTLKSMLQCITLYSKLLKDNGILIIEDIKDIKWLQSLTNATPSHLKPYIKTYDFRKNKRRSDDIVFTIDKLNL